MKTNIGSPATEETTMDRKIIKSQVEKRRRERMNCSLEHLRDMLLKEPQQLSETQHRLEKAEILEHAVHFLQNTVRGDRTAAGGGDGGGGGQRPSFQDGFSACLQRAAHFLGPRGKGLLDASFAARFPPSDSAGVQGRSEAGCSTQGSLAQTKSILRLLRQRSEHRRTDTSVHPYRRTVRRGFPTVPQQPEIPSGLGVTVAGPAGKQGRSPSCPTLWRPWP